MNSYFGRPAIRTLIRPLAAVLVLAFIAGLFGRHHWVLDLFSHFRIQYMTGAVLLCLAALAGKQRIMALGLGLFAAGLLVSLQYTYTAPWLFSGPKVPPNFTLVQYNKLYTNDDYNDIELWLRDPANDFDVVIVNESFPDAIQKLKAVKDLYPYQYPESPQERFNDISILSKHKIDVSTVRTDWQASYIFASKVIVTKPGIEPVTIYALHAHVPGGAQSFAQRNAETASLARIIAAEKARNVLFCGDWNLTPYSPVFGDVVRESGLNYQNYGLLPQTSWPSFAFLPLLKIPIDHVLFDDRLMLTDIRRGPANGSDHHSLIAQFRVDNGP